PLVVSLMLPPWSKIHRVDPTGSVPFECLNRILILAFVPDADDGLPAQSRSANLYRLPAGGYVRLYELSTSSGLARSRIRSASSSVRGSLFLRRLRRVSSSSFFSRYWIVCT